MLYRAWHAFSCFIYIPGRNTHSNGRGSICTPVLCNDTFSYGLRLIFYWCLSLSFFLHLCSFLTIWPHATHAPLYSCKLILPFVCRAPSLAFDIVRHSFRYLAFPYFLPYSYELRLFFEYIQNWNIGPVRTMHKHRTSWQGFCSVT